MINKDLLKQLIIEEKKKHKMNLAEQAPPAPAPALAGGTPAAAAKPATGQTTAAKQLVVPVDANTIKILQPIADTMKGRPDAKFLLDALAAVGIKPK